MNTIKDFIATGFYTGYLPISPTIAASWSAAMTYAIFESKLTGLQPVLLSLTGAALFLLLAIITISNDELNLTAKSIVIDKWAGQFISFTLIDLDMFFLIAAIILFLVFNHVDVWSANKKLTEKPKFYSMVHSVTAGCFTTIILWAVQIVIY